MSTWIQRAGLLVPLLLAACGPNIKEGPRIEDLADEAEPEKQVPVIESKPVGPDVDQAQENYRKLLELPQDPVTRAETLRRLADLQLQADETTGGTPDAGEQRLRETVALYNTLLAEHPTAPGNDRVLYQLARAYQNLGETAKAEEALQRMTQAYPQSEYMDDARFRRAELLFRLGQYDDAELEYKHVMAIEGGSPFYEPAQYKYGWALFKQSKYEQALDTFMVVLTRELPPGEQVDEAAAIAAVQPGKKDFAKDALRVSALALSYLGGGDAANQYFKSRKEPPYSPLLYQALGQTLLEKKRYTDAARAYSAFIELHPRHPLAPAFQARAIAAQEAGGFTDLTIQEKERYVRSYDPAAPYWGSKAPTADVAKDLRSHLEDLARYYQARGQKLREQDPAAARKDFTVAVGWYKRLLELHPQDPKVAELRFLYAESRFEAGDTMGAAAEYSKVAAEHPDYEKAPDAAYAAVLAYSRHATEVPEAQRPAALRRSVDAGLALAQRYPGHPQALAALTRAAEDLYRLNAWDEAVKTAAQVLAANPPAPDGLRRTALSVTADAQFSQKRYAEADAAYSRLLASASLTPEERKPLTERLAVSIYKQGEDQRKAGNLRGAADLFRRVNREAAGSSVAVNAEYDAAAALIALKDWSGAVVVLENFRKTWPSSEFAADVDRKLAVAYQNSGQQRDAAAVLQRIAGAGNEAPDARRDAAWLAATLLDQAKDPKAAAQYAAYIKEYPQPLDRATEARERLLAYAAARGDDAERQRLLREMVAVDAAAGAGRTERSKQAAARAALEFGRQDAARAAKIALKLPLKSSLPAKKQAVEKALATLTQAVEYGLADVTTAGTYELGQLYQDLSRDLLASGRPKGLSSLELEQYNLLLEEQAFPFEEKAIQFHEANLKRVSQGVYNEWVGRSLQALAQIAPGKYGKREQTAEVYDELR